MWVDYKPVDVGKGDDNTGIFHVDDDNTGIFHVDVDNTGIFSRC